jgi:hypothetical protein
MNAADVGYWQCAPKASSLLLRADEVIEWAANLLHLLRSPFGTKRR